MHKSLCYRDENRLSRFKTNWYKIILMSGSMRSIEHELTLVICSEAPEVIADRIGQLNEIPGYKLCWARDRSIKDSYFDTPERELKSREWALRIRESDGSPFIALKGPQEEDDSGIVARLEIEDAWSPEAFDKILRELSLHGFSTAVARKPKRLLDPFRQMEAAGFQLIQTRKTSRRTIDIVKLPQNVRAVEMAVDVVEYRFEAGRIRHYEVELESKSEVGPEAIRDIMRHLQAAFGGELKIWPYSKLATGAALDRLLQDRSIVVSENASLAPSDYEKIEALLNAAPCD
jgi:inorganic triphosphatase YgiF